MVELLRVALLGAVLTGSAAAQDEPPADEPTTLADPDEDAPLTPKKGKLLVRAETVADGLVRTDEWAVVHVRMANGRGGTSASLGFSEIDIDSGSQVRYRRDVDLPSGTVKEVELYWRPTLGGARRELAVEPADGQGGHVPFVVQVVPGDAVAIGVIGDDALGLPVLVDTWSGSVPSRRPREAGSGPRQVFHGLMPTWSMPERSVGYAPLDWVVWPEADPSRISARQLEALLGWVADGGHLLVTVTDRWQQVAASPLHAALPVDVTGVADAADLTPLAAVAGSWGRAPGPAPVAVAEVRQAPGRFAQAMARLDDGRPVWAVGSYGLGSVHVLLANPQVAPLSGAVDREALWRRLLWLPPIDASPSWMTNGARLADHGPDPERTLQPLALAMRLYRPDGDCAWAGAADPLGYGYGWGETPRQQWQNRLREELQDIPGVAPLPISWLVAFSLVYLLAIGPFDYMVLRLLKRQPLTWITFPAMVAAFSGAALYGTALAKGNRAVVNRVEVVDVLPGAGMWRGETWLGVFSTMRTSLSVRSGYPDGLVSPLFERGAGEGAPWGFMTDPRVISSEGPGATAWGAETWTLAYAHSQWTAPERGAVALSREGDQWVLQSTLPFDLTWAELRVGGSTWPLGSLSAGERRAVDAFSGVPSGGSPPDAPLYDALLEYAEVGHGHLESRRGALLVGVTAEPVEPLEIEGLSPESRVTTVVRVPLATSAQLEAWGVGGGMMPNTAFDGGSW